MNYMIEQKSKKNNQHAKPANVKQAESVINILRSRSSGEMLATSKQLSNNEQAPGDDLPKPLLTKLGTYLNEDFSNVKVHKESRQAENAQALAFTSGEHIHFAPGQYQPTTLTGQELIGHEIKHVSQQRAGRVPATSMHRGTAVNKDHKLEQEAKLVGKAITGMNRPQALLNNPHQINSPFTAEGSVRQFALPAVLAGLGAAEWLAAGALGYTIASDGVKKASPDVSYSFDEVDGVLLPGGGSDVAAHKNAHPNANIFEATHKFALWAGTSGYRKMGIKFGINFLFDNAGAIGNISLSLLDVYDWPGFGGNFNVNITSRSLAAGAASFRFTINVGADNSWFVANHPGSIQLQLRGGDGDLSITADNFYGFTEIS